MNKILLPTDFSDNSLNAIKYAVQLFKDQTCDFILLNTFTPAIASVEYMEVASAQFGLLDAMKEASKTGLNTIREKIESEFKNPKHTFSQISSFNMLSTEISDLYEGNVMDIIVMGTKGATGAKEIFFGSNAVSIVKKMKNCPVLLVPENYEFVIPKQIAFPTDYNRYCDAKELQYLKNMADLHASKIRVVHINVEEKLDENQENNFTILKQYLSNYEHSFHWIPDYASKATGITDFIEELEIDMLAMVQYSHSFLERIMREPVIKKIGFHLTIPFLVIPE